MNCVQTIISGIEVMMELLGAGDEFGPAVSTTVRMDGPSGPASGSFMDLLMSGSLPAVASNGTQCRVPVAPDVIDRIDEWCMQYAP